MLPIVGFLIQQILGIFNSQVEILKIFSLIDISLAYYPI
jgi:hypothetical protein